MKPRKLRFARSHCRRRRNIMGWKIVEFERVVPSYLSSYYYDYRKRFIMKLAGSRIVEVSTPFIWFPAYERTQCSADLSGKVEHPGYIYYTDNLSLYTNVMAAFKIVPASYRPWMRP